ncbi:unnamed protein product [Amoebophrya sp. A120]|nr:unnamed protein product [Amoebophrya sp. A120]|eukprot:GSA120T00025008001.1
MPETRGTRGGPTLRRRGAQRRPRRWRCKEEKGLVPGMRKSGKNRVEITGVLTRLELAVLPPRGEGVTQQIRSVVAMQMVALWRERKAGERKETDHGAILRYRFSTQII